MITREVAGLILEVRSPSMYRVKGQPFVLLYEITGWWVYQEFDGEEPRICHHRGYSSLDVACRQLSIALVKQEATAS